MSASSSPPTRFTYGLMSPWPNISQDNINHYGAIPEQVIREKSYREKHWGADYPFIWDWAHPRTFYAWLFKHVKLEDLLYKGNFKPLSSSPDSCFMYPILEMGGYHGKFIPEILYYWNIANTLSHFSLSKEVGYHQLGQKEVNKMVRTWPKYEQLEQSGSGISSRYKKSKADVIIISSGNSIQLDTFLSVFMRRAQGFNKIYVIYEARQGEDERFKKVHKKFQHVTFEHMIQSKDMLKSTLLKHLSKDSSSSHVVLACDTAVLRRKADFTYCIRELERTFAYGFYLHKYASKFYAPHELAPYSFLSDNLIAWQLRYGLSVWSYPNALGMTLYRKKDVVKALYSMKFSTINQFKNIWSHYIPYDRAVGLLGKESWAGGSR